MKCPWRPEQVTEKTDKNMREIVRIDFADCYEAECPYYSPVRRISENLSTVEYCRRTKQEVKG